MVDRRAAMPATPVVDEMLVACGMHFAELPDAAWAVEREPAPQLELELEELMVAHEARARTEGRAARSHR